MWLDLANYPTLRSSLSVTLSRDGERENENRKTPGQAYCPPGEGEVERPSLGLKASIFNRVVR